jgi:Protein of unknown function DUF262/Protein of unknown function (DUF1524)
MTDGGTGKGFEFSSLGIGSVLKLHRLHVPQYQREYAWEVDQVDQLYADFSSAKAEAKDYFLGTIVTIARGGTKPLEIVDGQQRLTTTAILLAAIRDFLQQRGAAEMIVESINSEFLSTIDRAIGERVPKLRLNIDDNVFFAKLLNEGPQSQDLNPTRQSHDLLLDAAKSAKNWVAKLADTFAVADQPARLNDWIEFVENNATVILLEAPNGAQAFKMFETLNDRGLKTSQADLVKSYLFGQSGERIGEAQSRWSSMRDSLEEIADEDRAINFLRHALIATKSFVRAEDVYDVTQKQVRGESNSVEFLAELERLSRVYVATYHADSEYWSSYSAASVKALRTLNKFDIKPMRPLTLAIALKFTPALSEKAFMLLVSIAVRLLIASATRSGTNEQTFASAAIGVFKGEIASISDLKDTLQRVIVSDQDFKSAFANARSSKPDQARYYLRALELASSNEKEPWYVPNDDQAAITLEHVLPKTMRPGKWPRFDQEDARRYLKRLGNLCLLNRQENSIVDNDSFDAKKAVFKDKCPYVLTRQIADYDEWSPDSIEKRQANMADLATRAWPV